MLVKRRKIPVNIVCAGQPVTVLGLLIRAACTLHQPGPYQAWKGFEWATLDQLHEKGLIDDPKHKNKSLALTDDGVADAAAAFQWLFGVEGDAR
jgi:hypothetical protein